MEPKLRLIRKTDTSPTKNTCPAVWATGRGTFVVVGKKAGPGIIAQANAGDDEWAVEVPADVFPELNPDA